jgi:endonuclease/exonuclease/phosphatase family metal-dependent hydrolase
MSQTGPPSILEHDLNRYFPELLKFDSTAEMERSELWRKIGPEADRILNAVVLSEPPAVAGGLRQNSRSSNSGMAALQPPATAGGSDKIRALAWNLERGIKFDGIVNVLKNDERLKGRDVLLLSELDYGMARSENRFVARDLADDLGLNWAFAPVYIPLQKGSGVESDVEGENTASIHGIAMMSPWPMRNVHAVPLPNGKDKMQGKEKRLGRLRALIAEIKHPNGPFRAASIHLDAHCSRRHRVTQMRIILDHLAMLPEMPTLIGGDWNTTGFNSQSSTRAILGYFRRVAMGPKNVATNHFPHPDRYFERAMFSEIERGGYDYRSLNNLGVGTLHYELGDVEKNTNLRDWVPEWCFPFIFWAAGRVGGKVSVRLDWFAAKGLTLAPGRHPQTVQGLGGDGSPLSDHDPITVDVSVART